MKTFFACVLLGSTFQLILTSAQSCGFSTTPEINVTDAISLNSPFRLSSSSSSAAESGSNIWQWTLATVSSDEGPNRTVENHLWLDTTPNLDLIDPEFGYLGCGVVIHGLKYDTLVNGQADPGDCSTIFNKKCLNTLLTNAHIQSEYINGDTYLHEYYQEQNKTAYRHCADLGRLYQQNDDSPGLPPECSDSLNPDAWVETFGILSNLLVHSNLSLTFPVFASPQANTICPGDPSTGDVSHPLIAWGDARYSETNLLAYNRSATLVTPILISMMANRSIETLTPLSNYTEQHLMCFRPENFERTSVHPTAVPNTAESSSRSIVGTVLGSLIIAALFC